MATIIGILVLYGCLNMLWTIILVSISPICSLKNVLFYYVRLFLTTFRSIFQDNKIAKMKLQPYLKRLHNSKKNREKIYGFGIMLIQNWPLFLTDNIYTQSIKQFWILSTSVDFLYFCQNSTLSYECMHIFHHTSLSILLFK